jgi:regulator of protease activity HflC (stomatin/prohibitin superfamily)
MPNKDDKNWTVLTNKRPSIETAITDGVRNLGGPLVIVVALFLAFIAAFSSVVVYINPNEYGIKEVKLGVRRGIQNKVYESGWVVAIPGFSRYHILPRGEQVYDMTNHAEERVAVPHRSDKAAHIQTSDGFFVDVDVTILYRISDPYKVVTIIGPGELFVDNGITPRAEPILKQALGPLTTEAFYNSRLRTAQLKLAKEMLNTELLGKGLQVDHVLIRYFEYSPEIQRNIEEKKLKDQLVYKNQSEAKAATAEANLKKITQEGEARLVVKLQEGEAYTVTKRAEQELYSRKRHAEGDLLVKLAEAHRTELKNTALQGTGSEYMVGLKMAEVLDGIQFIMLPSDGGMGFNPLDLDRTLKLFGTDKK